MSIITIQQARNYIDGNLTYKSIKSQCHDISSYKILFNSIFSVISLSSELSYNEKKNYLDRLKTRILNANSDKLMPLIKKTEDLISILTPNIQQYLKQLDQEYNEIISIERDLRTSFTKLFTHLVLNSVSSKLNYTTRGVPIDLSIKLLRDALRNSKINKTVLYNLELSLKDAFQINKVSDDYNLSPVKYYENHRPLLTFLIYRMIGSIKPEYQGRPFSFVAAPNVTHNIFLKISKADSAKKFIVQVINTGEGANSIGNGRIQDIVYKGVRESDLTLLVDFFLQQNENFFLHKWKLEKTLKSKSFSIESGFEHCYQKGDNCVIKSLMSCINQSIPDRISYKTFKFHFTQNLIQTMENAIESNIINEQSDSKLNEKLKNSYIILEKRKLKKEILELEHLIQEEKKEVETLHKLKEICQQTIINSSRINENLKSEIEVLSSKILELNNTIEAKDLIIASSETKIISKKNELEETYSKF